MSDDDRVADVLASWYERRERGEGEDPEDVVRAHADLAGPLEEHFAAQALFDRIAGRSPGGRAESPAEGFVPGGGRPPPFAFGDYDVTAEIARGGMGVVYRARHRSLDRWVALKMVRAGALATAGELFRFRNEAEAAASLDHQGIVAVHDVGSVDGQPYFTMRLVEGGNLASRAGAHAGDVRWAARVVEAVARAVEYGHRRGVLHRDLKPANILLEADERPVITDFGLARRTEAGALGPTQTGSILGTPAYMAPEQARGEKGVTTAADVWSLGVVLYELLAGAVPFAGDGAMEVLRKVVADDPAPPSRRAPGIPRDLESICLRCLRKEPRDRYPSAGALANDLGRFLEGRSVVARPLGLGPRAFRWVRRHRAWATVAAVVLLAAGGWAARSYRDLIESAALERRLRAPLYLALGAQAAREEMPSQAGFLFARGAHLDPSRIARIGMLAHRGPLPVRMVPLASGEIWRIVFDASGDRAAVGTDRGVFLWDVERDEAHPLGEGASAVPVRGIAFHPDGKRLATGDENGTAVLWDLAGRRPVARSPLPSRGAAVASLAVAGEGRYVVYGGGDEYLRIWDLEGDGSREVAFEPAGEAPIEGRRPVVRYVVSDPSGKRVLVGAQLPRSAGPSSGEGRIWDVPSGTFLPGAVALAGIPWCMDFTPDGRHLASAEGAGLGRWRTGDLSSAGRLSLDPDVGAAAFARDGRTVVYGTQEGHVRRWDPDTGHAVGPAIVQPQPVRAVAVTPDGGHVATGGQDGVLRLWPIPTGAPEARVFRGFAGATAVAVGAGDRRLLVATDEPALHLADLASGRTVARAGIPGTAEVVTATEDGWWCVARDRAGRAHWLSVRVTPREALEVVDLGPLEGFPPSSASAVFDERGRSLLATGRAERVLRRWTRVGAALRDEVVREDVRFVTVAGGARHLVLLDGRGTVRVLPSTPSLPEVGTMPVDSNFDSLAAAPDARRVALWSSFSPVAQLVDPTPPSREVGSLPQAATVEGVVFSPDGKALMTCHAQAGRLEFVDASTGQPLGRVLRHGGRELLLHPTFSRSGAYAAVVTNGGEVHVWNVAWLRDDPEVDVAREWERAQLAALHTIDDADERRRPIPLPEWRARRARWVEPSGR